MTCSLGSWPNIFKWWVIYFSIKIRKVTNSNIFICGMTWVGIELQHPNVIGILGTWDHVSRLGTFLFEAKWAVAAIYPCWLMISSGILPFIYRECCFNPRTVNPFLNQPGFNGMIEGFWTWDLHHETWSEGFMCHSLQLTSSMLRIIKSSKFAMKEISV